MPSLIGRIKALRPVINPVPPARLLITAVLTASFRSLSPEDAPPIGFGRSKRNRGAQRHRAELPGLTDGPEADLVVLVRIGEQLVVVELADEGNLVRVFAGHRPEDAEGRRHRIAAPFDRQLDD